MAYLSQKKSNGLPPKAVVLREEFVGLTHDPLVAIVLNQLLYWTQRVKDFDLFLEEERFINPECNVAPRHGWLYKTANDLIEETMICVDRTTIRRYLKCLIEQGWVEERTNPHNKWDMTSQYRLNIRRLQEDLSDIGFELPGIKRIQNEHFTPSNAVHSEEQISPSNDFELQDAPSVEEYSPSEEEIAPSERLNSPLNIQRLQT
jgi:hypothetical protein